MRSKAMQMFVCGFWKESVLLMEEFLSSVTISYQKIGTVYFNFIAAEVESVL
jgi:hypothetical protein